MSVPDDVFSPPRRRHGRSVSAFVDRRSLRRLESYPPYLPQSGSFAQLRRSDLLADDRQPPPAGPSSPIVAATRIVSSVYKSFSSTARRRDMSPADNGMYSTAVESTPPIPSRYIPNDAPRPTIEQIAMGLHVSCTPHLRPPRASPPPHYARSRHRGASDGSCPPSHSSSPARSANVDSQRRRPSTSAGAPPLPPPPARSSLKKPALAPHSAPPSARIVPSVSDLSLTGSTLTAPPPQRSSRSTSVSFLPNRIQASVSKLLRAPSRRADSSLNAKLSDSEGTPSPDLTPRKMVRFLSSPDVGEYELGTPPSPTKV